MQIVVTGGAGFIGANLTETLARDGHRVRVVDNLSTGFERHLAEVRAEADVDLVRCDLFAEPDRLPGLVEGADAVVHLAANADVRFGWDAPRRDLEQNVIATHNVLEAMRATGVRRILFSSTGSVYGACPVIPTPEDAPFPVQTSLYGASKAAAEDFIAAYAEAGTIAATVFRFVSVLGPRYSHGHVIDFVRQLPPRTRTVWSCSATATSERATCMSTTASQPSPPVSSTIPGSRCSTSASTATAPCATRSHGSANGSASRRRSSTRVATGAGSATTPSSTSTRRAIASQRMGASRRHPCRGRVDRRLPARQRVDPRGQR